MWGQTHRHGDDRKRETKGREIQMHCELWSKCVGPATRGPESSFWLMFCIFWTPHLLSLQVCLPLSSCLSCYLSLSLWFLSPLRVMLHTWQLCLWFKQHPVPRRAARNVFRTSFILLPNTDKIASFHTKHKVSISHLITRSFCHLKCLKCQFRRLPITLDNLQSAVNNFYRDYFFSGK